MVYALAQIYSSGTEYDASNASSTYTIPAALGTIGTKTASSFVINLNSANYNSSKLPLIAINIMYKNASNVWQYTSVRAGNTAASGTILTQINNAVTTITITQIAHANMLSPYTTAGVNLYIYIQILN